MEQMAKYYWGMLTAAAGSSSPRSYWPPPAHATAAGEPSWEELAFARDAAGHLGGCVWPPRSYTCTFCRREFRSAQALGGHMNVHRRDRARLRQCASPDHDDAHKQQPSIDIAPPAADHHHQLLQLQESPLLRAKAAVSISGPKSTCCDHQIYSHDHQEAVITTTTSPSYISTVVKESKNKLVISIPAATIDDEDEVTVAAERRKRRRVHQQPEALLPLFFLRPLASSKSGAEHDAKVPKVITSPSSPNTLHLAARQEVDLELRLALK
ncbi:hypothetical protein SEVIR_2G002800v4 [Setaria viridis]|nr:probable transcriptional regulator RABBIT EARS [Setaria viridis]